MDPITQGVIGASLPLFACKKENLIPAAMLGMLAGMSADLDVLIRSANDPLMFLEYHRQFSHSLLFVPIGGLLCSLVLHQLISKRCNLTFQQSWLYCTLGFATHGLLDTCTSYGTQLLWPFSDERIAWNIISVVDPLFTLPILIFIVLTLLRRNLLYACLALLWVGVYLSLGFIQRERAEEAISELAKQRKHTFVRLEAKPSFANLLVWKIVYETQENYHVDAVRLGQFGKIYPGTSISKLNIKEAFPWLKASSQQAKDIERFHWFSNGFIAQDPLNKLRIIDIRYSIVPNQIKALWGITLLPTLKEDLHIRYLTQREVSPESNQAFFDMLVGNDLN
ncbi:metal-dependent hydrolase [Vibrio sagamiensis]|uniref:Integral membrane protein n=1 Tax=Vibrio sagamiensis NBRC 104589 TaxID=1219064 RepID=A0A511QCF5_9VIBR|nr:metal-dependent hydrolase [Vibrio sagamiensis]PNQ53819.1 metal-dependent hydrolase [Vibrio agarivorans]GEM74975.1 hypothetical protein VSA01S_10870 [Vibrio sagamiensis NBRC 104589]